MQKDHSDSSDSSHGGDLYVFFLHPNEHPLALGDPVERLDKRI